MSSPSGGHSSGNFNNSNSYIQRSAEQIILGNYTDEVTLLGTAIQILLSFLNFDVLADIRDLSADFVNWEWSKQHVLCTSLDLVALLPVLGILKNTDEAAALVKNGKKALNGASTVGEGTNKISKLADDIVEWIGSKFRVITNEAGDKVFLSADGTKRVRFDLNNPVPHNNPHGHVEQLVNNKWIKSGPIYPTDVPHN